MLREQLPVQVDSCLTLHFPENQYSRKHPVQIPAASVAVDPGVLPLAVAHDEVVAALVAGGAGFAAIPPAALDALGTVEEVQQARMKRRPSQSP